MTREMLALISQMTFVVTGFVYAFLAAWTTVLYRGKSAMDLSATERDILYGRADVGKRIRVFILNLFASVYSPQVWIITGVVTLAAYLLARYGSWGAVVILIAILITVAFGRRVAKQLRKIP